MIKDSIVIMGRKVPVYFLNVPKEHKGYILDYLRERLQAKSLQPLCFEVNAHCIGHPASDWLAVNLPKCMAASFSGNSSVTLPAYVASCLQDHEISVPLGGFGLICRKAWIVRQIELIESNAKPPLLERFKAFLWRF